MGESWVVYASAIEWNYDRHRQQELALALGSTRPVLYLEPPSLRPRRGNGPARVGERVWRLRPPTLLPLGRQLEPANQLNRIAGALAVKRALRQLSGDATARTTLVLDEDIAWPLARLLGSERVVYDAVDLDYTVARSRISRRHLRRAHERALHSASVVTCSSAPLESICARPWLSVASLRNGCDPEHFSPDGELAPPPAGASRPLIGYAGALDERIVDLDWLIGIAKARPDWTVVVCGRAGRRTLRRIAGHDNVVYTGPVRYERLPATIRSWDVCLIPYRVSQERICYTQPKKLYEYLACGKPVVATPIPGVIASGAPVAIAASAPQAVAELADLLAASREAVAARAVVLTAHAREHSWASRGRELDELFRSLSRSLAVARACDQSEQLLSAEPRLGGRMG